MVLEVSTLFLGNKNSTLVGNDLIHRTEYARVTQYNYARITSESPCKGACTDHVASCTVVVLHSPTTKRTTLSHSPNFMTMLTFIPLIDWVTGGLGNTNPTPEEQVLFCSGLGARPCVLEAYILRGFAYAAPDSEKFNHAGWIRDFRNFFEMIAQVRHISLHIEDSSRLLSSGAVLVDKGSGRITHVELEPDLVPHSASSSLPSPRRIVITLEHPDFAGQYTTAQECQDLFIGSLLNSRREPEPTPLKLQFDSQSYLLPHPLSDEARQLIRSKRLYEPSSVQSAIIRAFGKTDDWMNEGGNSRMSNQFATLRSLLKSVADDRPCELCPKEASKMCSACRGAWYCGDVHQRQDWRMHKVWCRLHPYDK